MSATNTTTNYSLPIFIGADKPSWLADFNGAMNAIDAQMKVNADAIATKSPILTFNDTTEIDLTQSGNIITANLASNVSDKVGRALVTPIAPPAAEQIVAINTSGAQDALTLGDGLKIVNGQIEPSIDMNLSDIAKYTASDLTARPGTSGTGTVNASITKALNADGSIGKIYGDLQIEGAAAYSDYGYNTPIYVTPPKDGQYYSISAGIAYTRNASGAVIYLGTAYLFVLETGQVEVYTHTSISGNVWARFEACIYYFKDFGDTQ